MSDRSATPRGVPRTLVRLGASFLGVLAGFVVVGLAVTSCGLVAARSSAAKDVTAGVAGTREEAVPANPDLVRPRPVSRTELARLPRASTFGAVPSAPVDLRARSNGNVVRVGRLSPAFARPGGPAVASIPAEQVGMPTWLPVLAHRPGWVQVRLPSRPNGSTAWLPADGLRRARTSWSVRVDLSEQELTVRRERHVVGTWTVGEGARETPTPAGETFLLASFVDSGQSHSPVIFATGAHSETLDSYGGGPGTVAVHGWPAADGLRGRVSHGCLRVPATALDTFRLLPLGTPISIVA